MRRRSTRLFVLALVSLASLFDPAATHASEVTLVGAGDIARCDRHGDERTARLLDAIPGTVFTAGDNAYVSGSAAEFANCYHPTWGRHKARTRPAPGNHEYWTPNATPYYRYFYGDKYWTMQTRGGFYSYNLGAWHIVVLNSQCAEVSGGGCAAGSRQEKWLRADLAANRRLCTLAVWHHPRFSSGRDGNHPETAAFWKALYDYRAEVVINGHDHNYERFARQSPSGRADWSRGILQFVVGTGGAPFTGWTTVKANSQVRNNDTHGLLRLSLRAASFQWSFVPVAGRTFTDSGWRPCR